MQSVYKKVFQKSDIICFRGIYLDIRGKAGKMTFDIEILQYTPYNLYAFYHSA